MTTRITDSATKRAAVALLRSLGATEVIVRTAAANGNDKRGLGLQQFDVAEVRLSNAVVKQTSYQPLKLEITVSASEVEIKLGAIDDEAVDALRSLAGVSWGDHLLRVTKVTPEICAGSAYMYRISAEA